MNHNHLIELEEVILRPVVEEDIETMRLWRNKDSIRKSFIYQEEISSLQQKQWFKNYTEKKNDMMFIIQYKGQSIGTVALYDIDMKKKEAEFGRLMIGEQTARGLGIGRIVVQGVCEFGFNQLNLEGIVLEVFEENSYAKTIYESVGFQVVTDKEIPQGKVIKMKKIR